MVLAGDTRSPSLITDALQSPAQNATAWTGEDAMKANGVVVVDPSAMLKRPDGSRYDSHERKAWRAGAIRAFALVAIGLCTGLVLCRITLDVGMLEMLCKQSAWLAVTDGDCKPFCPQLPQR